MATLPPTVVKVPVPLGPPDVIRSVKLPPQATANANPKAGLTPIFSVPPVRLTFPHVSVSPARPSVNLGHPLNSSIIQQHANLLPVVGVSNPIPFGLNPQHNPTTTNYGSRVSAAIKALQRPSFSEPGGPKPTVNFGHRVVAAIRAVTRS